MSLALKVLTYYMIRPWKAAKYKLELKNLAHPKTGLYFPYKKVKKLPPVTAGYDEEKGLPYVVHQDKRLYFPASYSVESASAMYINLVEDENILGGGYRQKSPHQYESEIFRVADGDVLFDVGCAEALFALDKIDCVQKAYLIEFDSFWIDSLRATFEPYQSKVQIVEKLVTNEDSETTVTLSTLLTDADATSSFVKMDIEGYETTVIQDSLEFLSQYKRSIKLACCTYHKERDAEVLKDLFSSIGYQTESSDGYMLFLGDVFRPPYFRKGIIRATKQDG